MKAVILCRQTCLALHQETDHEGKWRQASDREVVCWQTISNHQGSVLSLPSLLSRDDGCSSSGEDAKQRGVERKAKMREADDGSLPPSTARLSASQSITRSTVYLSRLAVLLSICKQITRAR